MRIIAILLFAITIAGCQKNKTHDNRVIAGDWELRKSEGGIAGTIDYAPGNGNIIEFKTNGRYNRITGGAVYESGTYTIGPSSTAGQWILVMSAPASATTASVTINGNQLVFLRQAECCDFPDITFEKITPL